jgi:hypothetical protein
MQTFFMCLSICFIGSMCILRTLVTVHCMIQVIIKNLFTKLVSCFCTKATFLSQIQIILRNMYRNMTKSYQLKTSKLKVEVVSLYGESHFAVNPIFLLQSFKGKHINSAFHIFCNCV